jgi:hypothetical protein
LIFLVSCQKNNDTSDKPIDERSKTGIVPLKVATDIATNFFKMYYSNVDNKLIDNQMTADENGVPLFYIFNYKGGGFLVVSAEYGDMPILANDVNSVFPAKNTTINAGLGMWMLDTRERINAIRAGKENPTELSTALWKDFKENTYKADFKYVTLNDIRNSSNKLQTRDQRELPHPNNCSSSPYTNWQVGPFVNTTWGQGCGYNNLTLSYPFQSNGLCGHAPTGCVATAMAQVVRFHQFPSGFSYSSMPNNSGNSDISSLMFSCGELVGMDYGEIESGSYTSRIEGALQSWGYSNDASYGVYNSNYTNHIGNINAGRPVILDGYTEQSCFWGLWCWGSGKGHTWVSDGYQAWSHPCYGDGKAFYMNWGWGGSANGFYYSPIPTGIPNFYRNYQYERKILYDIHL